MIPKLHPKGSSFKGAATYLLHDKDKAETDERVAWVELRNVATDDPNIAWKIMIATAKDQDRLKAQAGIRNTGRKSDKSVLHLTLSWHPEQTPSKEDMIKAADGALSALSAEELQAMIVCHSDEEHPHIHLLINRVSPQDGRMLSSSNEKLNLSRWAQAYEEETEIYCENRIANNAMRDAGHYVRGDKNVPRHIFEQMRGAAVNDNSEVAGQQRKKDHALALRERNMHALHADQWRKLDQDHERETALTKRKLWSEIEAAKQAVADEYREKWKTLIQRQDKTHHVYNALEKNFFGRLANSVKVARLSGLDIDERQRNVIARTFNIATDAYERNRYFVASKEREVAELRRDQKTEEIKRSTPALERHYERLRDDRERFLKQREDLEQKQMVEKEALRRDWKQRRLDRQSAYEKAATKPKSGDALNKAFKSVADSKSNLDALVDKFEQREAFDKAAGFRENDATNDNEKDIDIADDD
jgi:hypothetical protein